MRLMPTHTWPHPRTDTRTHTHTGARGNPLAALYLCVCLLSLSHAQQGASEMASVRVSWQMSSVAHEATLTKFTNTGKLGDNE